MKRNALCDGVHADRQTGGRERLGQPGAGNKMLNFNDKTNRPIQIVLSPDDLEEAIRTVASELLTQREVERTDRRITRAAARERLKVDYTTLWRWDKSGYLPAIRIGRTVYYRETNVKKIE